eukprot:Clim_evm54s153 gene=Clim_evmTU54s153
MASFRNPFAAPTPYNAPTPFGGQNFSAPTPAHPAYSSFAAPTPFNPPTDFAAPTPGGAYYAQSVIPQTPAQQFYDQAYSVQTDTRAEVDFKEHPSGLVPQMQNIVATLDLNKKLDLSMISQKCKNTEYNPKRFAAVIMKQREPRTTALIFATGKLVVTGAKSEKDAILGAKKFTKAICQALKMSKVSDYSSFKVQNIVGSVNLGFRIELQKMSAEDNDQIASYEPEVFPGLVWKMVEPKVTLLVFGSGKVVLTGAKYEKDIIDAFELIFPALQQYRKYEPPAAQQE